MLQVEVTFCDKNQPNDDGFTLQLSLKMKYEEFARRVAAHLDHYDHEKLQFFRSNPNTSTAASAAVSNASTTTTTTTGSTAAALNDYKTAALSPFAIKYNPELTLRDAIASFGATKNYQQQQQQQQALGPVGPKRLYYQKLNIKVFELEDRRPFRVTWISANLKVERELCPMPFKKVTLLVYFQPFFHSYIDLHRLQL